MYASRSELNGRERIVWRELRRLGDDREAGIEEILTGDEGKNIMRVSRGTTPACRCGLPGSRKAATGTVYKEVKDEKEGKESIDCGVADAGAIGGSFRGPGRPFVVSIEPPEAEPEDLDSIREHCGFRPVQEIVVVAMCGRQEDHELLALFVLRFAELFDGLIDLGGTLEPRSLYTPRSYEREWADIAGQVNAWLAGMPGKIYTAYCLIDDEHSSPTHMCDAEFLRGWLRHPEFRMIH